MVDDLTAQSNAVDQAFKLRVQEYREVIEQLNGQRIQVCKLHKIVVPDCLPAELNLIFGGPQEKSFSCIFKNKFKPLKSEPK